MRPQGDDLSMGSNIAAVPVKQDVGPGDSVGGGELDLDLLGYDSDDDPAEDEAAQAEVSELFDYFSPA